MRQNQRQSRIKKGKTHVNGSKMQNIESQEKLEAKHQMKEEKKKNVKEYQIVYKIKEDGTPNEPNELNIVDEDSPPLLLKPRGSVTGFSERKKSLFKEKEKRKLEFGFTAVTKKNSKSETYFDPSLDTLTAPINVKFNSRTPKVFLPFRRSVTSQIRKQDRKSNFDFLGISDTRKYFYIPPSRRSWESEPSRVVARLVSLPS